MTPAFDVVLVSYNTRDLLLEALGTLVATPAPPLGQVFVVDNASTDGSPEAVREQFPQVELIALADNRGFAAANNVALRRCTAELVVLLNSDTMVSPDALPRLADRLAARGAVAAGPRLVDREGRPEMSFGPMLSPWAEARQWVWVRLARHGRGIARRLVERRLARERFVDWVSGACLMVRREAAVDAGLLDERYFMYEEDVDFCAALRARGGRVLFTPHAAITHLRGGSATTARPRGARAYDRSHLLFYEKHAPGWAPWLRAWLRLRGRRLR